MIHRKLAGWLRKHAAEDRNSLTVTVAPAQAGRTFQIELPRWSLRAGGALLAIGFILILAGGVLYGHLIRDALLLRDIRRENVQLRAQAARMKELEDQVAQLDRVRRQLYTLAGVPDAGAADSGDPGVADSMSIVAEPITVDATTELAQSAGACPLRLIPFRGPVSRGFTRGRGRDPAHAGIDIAGPEGAPVAAAGDGVVTFAGWDKTFGNLIVLEHPDRWETKYGHNSSLFVALGDSVRAGQTISLIGSTGISSAPHLHFEVLRDKKTIDPADIFPALRSGDSSEARSAPRSHG